MTARAGWVAQTFLVAAALVFVLIALRTDIIAAIDGATCLERAKDELILCVAPPDGWRMSLWVAVAVGLSSVLGALIASGRRRG